MAEGVPTPRIEKNLPIVIAPHQAPDPEYRSEAHTWCRLDAG
jgi:hypothetical protein